MAAAALWGVLQLLLLSWPVRSVGWPTVLLAFGVGAYGCGVFTVLIELFVARQLASANGTSIQQALETVTWTTAPPVEELIKIAPLLLAAWAMRGRVQWGLTDFVVLGGAVGTGFALLESVLQYAFAPGAQMTASPTGQGWTVASSLSPPFVSGFPEFLGHWFPSSVGKLELGTHAVTVPVERHMAWSVLGGLAVGLWVCARRWWVRTAGLVPLLLAIGQHGVTNYAAAKPATQQGPAMEWYDRIEANGLWTVGACLALAAVWDLRRRYRGKLRAQELETGHEHAISLQAERAGHDAVSALAAYGLLRLPWTWLIALRYARRRRALFYGSVQPRSRPEPLAALRDEIAVQSAQLDATSGADAWRGLSLRQAWKQARTGGSWPWWEKLILIVGLVLMIPSCVLTAGYASGWGKDLEAYFTNGASATSNTAGQGWTLLIACGVAGLLLAALRLVLTLRGLPRTRALAPAEPYAAGLLRVAVIGGALLAGVLLLTRAGTIGETSRVIDPLAMSFLLEKFLEIAPYLLIALLMFAGPAALPLELAMGGSLLTELLGLAAGRILAPVVARVGARLAARGAMTWARGALRGRWARGRFSRDPNRVRHGLSDPVDMATGRMFLPVTDLELPGVLPLVFSRRVDSGYRGGRWFGPTWASTADQRLEFDDEGAVFFTEDGLLLAYPHPAPGGGPVLPEEGARWPLAHRADGAYTVTDPGTGRVRTFTAHGDSGVALLREMTDRCGNRITFAYDADGAPAEIVHSGGYRLRLTTDGDRVTGLWLGEVRVMAYGYGNGPGAVDRHLTETYNSSGLPLRFSYDVAGRVTSWTDTNNRSYSYTYANPDGDQGRQNSDDHQNSEDHQDRVVAEGGAGGHHSFRFAYEGTHPDFPGLRVTTLTAADGATTRYLIDDRHQVVGEIDATGAVTRTTYDEAGRVVAETDALGRTTEFRYDEHGRLTGVVRADGSETAVERDAEGNAVRVTEPGGGPARLQSFDARGNLTARTDPLGATTRFTHDDHGALLAVTDPLGATTRVRCDAAGLPLEITDPLGATTRLARDAFGRVISVTDPLGAVTHYAWTPEGNLLRRTSPDGSTESWTYDGEGNLITHTDANGGVTRHEYTHFDLLAARTDPDGARYTFTHDAATRLTQVTNPQGMSWNYAYDAAGHLISESDFDGRTVSYTVDAAGQLTSRTSPLNETTHYTYDSLGRTVAQAVSDEITEFRWHPTGELRQATGPDADVTRAYDAAGRLVSETVNGRTLRLAYDPAGRPVRRETPAGAVTTYGYDLAGNRTRMTAAGRELSAVHDAGGRETRLSWGNALTLNQAWDPTGRLIGRSYTDPAGTALLQRAYTWRPDGHLTGTGDQRYTLDSVGRVTQVEAATAAPVAASDGSESYAYDQAGNQTHATWPGTHPGSDATGTRTYTGTRVQTAGSVRYEHDGAGRTTLRRKTRLSKKPDTWRYTWNAEDQLTTVTTPDGTIWRYRYDPLGRRTTKQRLAADGTVAEETRFTWHGATLVEQTTTSTDWTGAQTLTWDHDESGLTPLTQTTRTAPTSDTPQPDIDTRFYAIITDLIGTPTHLIDTSGAIAWQSRTTLWGTTTWNHDATAYTPLRFPGQYHDLETGHHYNVHRHYDPETARYLSPDPLGLAPSPNPTTYVHNPQTWCDPLGLAPDCSGTNRGRAAQQYGQAYEEHLVRELRGVGSFKESGREYDGAYIDEITGRGVWYEAKSGEFWENLMKNPKRLDKFYSTEGQKMGIAKSKGIDYAIITEKNIPAPVANWLTKKGIPWRIHPGPR
jgi:RHS repeat-associated protein